MEGSAAWGFYISWHPQIGSWKPNFTMFEILKTHMFDRSIPIKPHFSWSSHHSWICLMVKSSFLNRVDGQIPIKPCCLMVNSQLLISFNLMVKSHEIPMFLGDINWDLTGLLAVDFLHTWLQKNLVERTSEVSLQIFKACGRKTLKRKWLDMNYQWDVDRLLGFSWELYGIHWVKHGFRMGYVRLCLWDCSWDSNAKKNAVGSYGL